MEDNRPSASPSPTPAGNTRPKRRPRHHRPANPTHPSSAAAVPADNVSLAATAFFRRWWKLLVAVFLVAAVVSLVVSLLVKPLYRSSAVMIPTNSNRLTKAIMDYHYSMDFMDYGAERDCEYALQILTSKTMQMSVCQRFNLMEHYEIKPTNPHRMTAFEKKWESLFSARRTKYMAVEISVLDRDPQMAADIINYMLASYDTLCHAIHSVRAADAADIMRNVCSVAESEIDSLASLPASAWRTTLIGRKCKELSKMQARATQTDVERALEVSYKYVIDQARPADKKDRPKRALIVLAGSIGAVVMCIFALLLFAPRRDEQV